MKGRMLLILLAAWSQAGCGDLGDGTLGGPTETASYSLDVAPLLAANCAACHSGAMPSGGLDLSSHAGMLAGGDSGPALVPGWPDSSMIVERLETDDLLRRMPPGGALSVEALRMIREWIAAGALEN